MFNKITNNSQLDLVEYRILTAKEFAQITNMSERWAVQQLSTFRKLNNRKKLLFKDIPQIIAISM